MDGSQKTSNIRNLNRVKRDLPMEVSHILDIIINCSGYAKTAVTPDILETFLTYAKFLYSFVKDLGHGVSEKEASDILQRYISAIGSKSRIPPHLVKNIIAAQHKDFVQLSKARNVKALVEELIDIFEIVTNSKVGSNTFSGALRDIDTTASQSSFPALLASMSFGSSPADASAPVVAPVVTPAHEDTPAPELAPVVAPEQIIPPSSPAPDVPEIQTDSQPENPQDHPQEQPQDQSQDQTLTVVDAQPEIPQETSDDSYSSVVVTDAQPVDDSQYQAAVQSVQDDVFLACGSSQSQSQNQSQTSSQNLNPGSNQDSTIVELSQEGHYISTSIPEDLRERIKKSKVVIVLIN